MCYPSDINELDMNVLKVDAFPDGQKCCLCLSNEADESTLGWIYTLKLDGCRSVGANDFTDIAVHFFCLMMSSKLRPRGSDRHGIMGFITQDIYQEIKRADTLLCTYCKKKGATVNCSQTQCNVKFHLSCGIKNHSLHNYKQIRSYCVKHRPKQSLPDSTRTAMLEMDNDCILCYDSISVKDEMIYIWPICCKPTALLHRKCLQRMALSSGFYFKCPFCSNTKKFCQAMKELGIYIHQQAASWEREPNAYQELNSSLRCEAENCLCERGRDFKRRYSQWDLIPCSSCGGNAIHVTCSNFWSGNKYNRSTYNLDWNCATCTNLINGIRAEEVDDQTYSQQPNIPQRANQMTEDSDDTDDELIMECDGAFPLPLCNEYIRHDPYPTFPYPARLDRQFNFVLPHGLSGRNGNIKRECDSDRSSPGCSSYSDGPERSMYSGFPERRNYSTVPEYRRYRSVPGYWTSSDVPEYRTSNGVPGYQTGSNVPERRSYSIFSEPNAYSSEPGYRAYSTVPRSNAYDVPRYRNYTSEPGCSTSGERPGYSTVSSMPGCSNSRSCPGYTTASSRPGSSIINSVPGTSTASGMPDCHRNRRSTGISQKFKDLLKKSRDPSSRLQIDNDLQYVLPGSSTVRKLETGTAVSGVDVRSFLKKISALNALKRARFNAIDRELEDYATNRELEDYATNRELYSNNAFSRPDNTFISGPNSSAAFDRATYIREPAGSIGSHGNGDSTSIRETEGNPHISRTGNITGMRSAEGSNHITGVGGSTGVRGTPPPSSTPIRRAGSSTGTRGAEGSNHISETGGSTSVRGAPPGNTHISRTGDSTGTRGTEGSTHIYRAGGSTGMRGAEGRNHISGTGNRIGTDEAGCSTGLGGAGGSNGNTRARLSNANRRLNNILTGTHIAGRGNEGPLHINGIIPPHLVDPNKLSDKVIFMDGRHAKELIEELKKYPYVDPNVIVID